ncbi:MAG: glycosyltransferase family 39 protein [bacterium]|nr:glycosyltransferase family 39 protein [bacterium]
MWRGVLAAGLVILAGCAFFYRMDKPSMWLDEVFHWSLTRAPAWSLMNEGPLEWKQLAHLYYLAVKWCDQLFANRDFAVRFPQAASATLTVLFVYLLTQHLFSTGAAVLACLLVMSDPLMVEYARQNRFYHMTSLGFAATLYFYFAFLETRRWRDWVGFILAASFLLRVGSFGIMVAIALGILTLVLYASTLTSGEDRVPYAVNGRVFLKLGFAAVLIALLFMPYPVRLVQFYLSTGGSPGAMDGFWTGPFDLTVPAIGKFVHSRLAHWDDIKTREVWYIVLFVSSVVGSLMWRRGKAMVFIATCLLVTLPILYTMNKGHAEVMPKRFLYLWPCYYVLLAGGVSMLACTVRVAVTNVIHMVRLGYLWSRVGAWICSSAVWLLFFWYAVWPLLAYHVHYVGNSYFSERHWYKQIARLVSAEITTNDFFFWNNQHNDYWLLDFPYWPTNLTVRVTPVRPHEMTAAVLQSALTTRTAVWLHGFEPQQYGVPNIYAIRLPVAGSILWLCKSHYVTNRMTQRADEERLLRRIVERSDFPEIEAARQLRDLYLTAGRTNEAHLLAEGMGRWYASYPAIEFAYAHFKQHGDRPSALRLFQHHADLYFWVPGLQIEVAREAWTQGRYDLVTRYARRAAFFGADRDASARELVARGYLALSNYAQATRWARSALARVRKAKDPYITTNRRTALESFYRGLLPYATTGATEIEERLAEWTARQDEASLLTVWQYLDHVHSDVTQRATLTKIARRRKELRPLAYLLEVWDAPNLSQRQIALKRLNASVRAPTWPVHLYALQCCVPVEWQQEMTIPFKELPQRGFDLRKATLNLWQLLEQYYGARLDWPAITNFYGFVKAQSPSLSWWAALRESEVAAQYGITSHIVQLLAPHAEVYRGNQQLTLRMNNLTKLVKANDTPR